MYKAVSSAALLTEGLVTGTNTPMTPNEAIFSLGAVSFLSSSVCVPACFSLSSSLSSL